MILLKGKLLEQRGTANAPIMVYENYLYRWLTFGDEYIQTIIHKRKPWLAKLKYLPALCTAFLSRSQHTYLFGAGGGSAIHYIKHFHPYLCLEAVEINEEIIALAKGYFEITQPIIHANAFTYVAELPLVDSVLIDIFINSMLPEALTAGDYLMRCLEKVKLGLSLNLVHAQNPYTFRLIEKIRETVTNRTLCLFVKGHGNIILHVYKEKNYLADIQRLVTNKTIKKPMWTPQLGLCSTLM